ncbi:MAG: DUF3429 domain-containing protein [Sphingomonas adhaesiva]|uniref:DUF3429 domain-containing protein n=1 Tax=Sphingomonas adhaesiva TaxID=28212 RepID=UPI002FFA895C
MTPASPDRPALERAAVALGFAGLLPQMAAVALLLGDVPIATAAAFGYALLILSFLGGIWWGFAMHRRGDATQGRLALLAVVPNLVAFAILLAATVTGHVEWGLVATGSAILLTLPVDRMLVRRGDAPADWMRLRVPLSVGLGALTILAGALSA